MFFSPLDHLHLTAIRNPLGLTHRQHDFLADSYSSPPSSSPSAASSSSSSASSSASSSSNVYNLWQDAPDFPSPYLPALSSPALQQHHASPASGRSFHNITYQPSQDDRTNSRLVPMLPYSTTNDNDTFTRRIAVVPQPHPTLGLSSSTQHIPTTNSSADERPVRSLIFEPIYPSPSYTLSAAISSAPGSASPATYPALAPPLPPPPPSSTCSPHSSPSPSPPSSPDSKSLPAPPPPSVHAFRLDTLQSVDPSDDPCPLSLHDLMIPSEEQEYQGHSYHFSLQSLSPPRSKPQCFSEEKPPLEETNVPKRKGKSKMHTCSLCQKSFPRPSGLRTHMNSHSGDKPYKCPVSSCAKSFTVRSNAKRHIRTHGIHLPFPQAADAASPTAGDSLGQTDKDAQRALRIRWVGQNQDEHPEDHSSGQPLNLQGSACIRGVDDDDFRKSRLEDVRNRGDRPQGPFGSPGRSAGTSRSDPLPRKHPQKHSSQCSSVLTKGVV